MKIKQLEITDNLPQYLECISSLNSPDVVPASMNDVVWTLSTRPHNIITFVGILDSKIVATATLILEHKLRYKNKCAHIEDVCVHDDYRGRRYGHDMVKHLVNVAKEYGCYKVKLNCSNKLVSFYSKLGFTVDANHMILKISS